MELTKAQEQDWDDFIKEYVRKKDSTKAQRQQIVKEIFKVDVNQSWILEPNFGRGEPVPASDYYLFVAEVLKISYPETEEEKLFRDAGMGWLYDYYIKIQPYLQIQKLYDLQCECCPPVHGSFFRRWSTNKYQRLCNEYPDLYTMDMLPSWVVNIEVN